MKKILILCFIMFLNYSLSLSQQVPLIVPPSPQAQAFSRYGEIPVDLSTGVPNISIPLYTIKEGKIELPISISYHASGIKVQDVASEVGLGWVLNCGGIVSRTVFGIPDEKNLIKAFSNSEQLHSSLISASYIFDQSCRCLKGIRDFEYQLDESESSQDYLSDRFSYSLPNGISGVFRYDYSDFNNVIKLPYRPLKIERILNIPHPSYEQTKIIGFKITDENGTMYIFEPFLTYATGFYTEWYLTKMISFDGIDVITLEYEPQSSNSSIPIESKILINPAKDKSGCEGHSAGNLFSVLSTSTTTLPSFNAPVLKTIISSTTKLTFNYTNYRLDFNQLRQLSNITISPINNSLQIIKSIDFTPMYFGTNSADYRLGLNSVTIGIPENSQSQKYEFKYEDIALPPYPYKMYNYAAYNYTPKYSEDFWGYYNGANSSGLVPVDFILDYTDRTSYGGDKSPNLYYSKACMIKQIKYPTGGKTVFQFERNFAQYIYPYKYPENTDGYVGGFRIGAITNYDEKNEVVGTKTYEYIGAVSKQITRESFVEDQRKAMKIDYLAIDGGFGFCYTSYSNKMIFSNPILPIEVGAGLSIMYEKVIEYNGTKASNMGKTIYEYNRSNSPSDFINNTHPLEWELPKFYHPFHYDRGNYTPNLVSKTEYAFDGVNYHIMKKTQNTYTTLYPKEHLTGIKLTRNIQYNSGYFGAALLNPNNRPDVNLNPIISEYVQSIVAIDTKAFQETSLLTKTENYTYNPMDSTQYIVNETKIEYDSAYLQVKKQTSTTSVGGKSVVSEFKYPFDYTVPPYNSMVQMNNIAPVIEKTERINSTLIKSTKTNHSYWECDDASSTVAYGSMEIEQGMQNPSTSSFSITNSSVINIDFRLEMSIGHCWLTINGPTTINELYYGRGGSENNFYTDNFSKSFNLSPGSYTISISYIYADGHTNTGFYGIANYSVLTSDTKLNASKTNTPTGKIYPSTVDVRTGVNPYETQLSFENYDIRGNIVSLTQKDSVKYTYIWSYNGSYPVAKIINGNYTSIESTLGGADALKTFFKNPAPSDDYIRSFLSPLRSNSATSTMQIYIYTYKPLVGMTSMTDPRGVTTYYDYDNFNRLKETYMIENGVKKILQKHEYHYTNQ